MKRIFRFKKKKELIKIEIEFEDGVFSASGSIINLDTFRIVMNGQILDEAFKEITDWTFLRIYRLWKLYHLNNLHPGTERQEEALEREFGGVRADKYKEQCEYLKSLGIYEDNGYIFGSGWLKRKIPLKDVREIKKLLREEL